MKKSQFNTLVKEPNEAASSHINALQEVVAQFPFFTSAQLLLTKSFQNSENLNFDNQLRKTAAMVADRQQLHHLIFNTTPTVEIAKTTEHTAQQVPHSEEKEITPADQFLEQQILTEAINSSILQEVSGENQDDEATLEETIEAITSHDSKLEPLKKNNEDFESKPHGFSAWVQHFSDRDEKEINTLPSERTKNMFSTISEQAKAIQEKAEFYSAAKMAKLSVVEQDDLVTETLAQVYANQGNFEKAIKAYEKLQLKYPEKKIYFAGRIKEIQSQYNF